MLSLEQAKDKIIQYAKSMFDRGLTSGASANMSVRFDGGWVCTPTNSCFGFLDSDAFSIMNEAGEWISGDKPSKEFILHKAMYDLRPLDTCVVHLHSTYAVVYSCLPTDQPDNCVPTYTPYLTMRLGDIAMIPYFAPGEMDLAAAVRKVAAKHAGILMANHGPIASGKTVEAAVFGIEELEESCRIALTLSSLPDQNAVLLTQEQIDFLKNRKTK